MQCGRTLEVKPIIRGHLNNTCINCLHTGIMGAKVCNGFGQVSKLSDIYALEPDTAYYYYEHY